MTGSPVDGHVARAEADDTGVERARAVPREHVDVAPDHTDDVGMAVARDVVVATGNAADRERGRDLPRHHGR